jgi:site-specific DNA recombinase
LAGQEEQLRSDAARQQQLAGIAASLEAFRTRVQHGLATATFEQRRQLVLLLIDRVVVTDADVEIRYVLPTSSESERIRFCQLRKDYFDGPASGQNDEAMDCVGALDNFGFKLGKNGFQGGVKHRPRGAAVGKELFHKREHSEQG